MSDRQITANVMARARYSAALPELKVFSAKQYCDWVQQNPVPCDDQLVAGVRDRLWNSVPFSGLSKRRTYSKERLIASYVRSAEVLNEANDACTRFYQQLIRSLIQRRGKALNWLPAVQQSESALLGSVPYQLTHPPVIITADLALMDERGLFDALHDDLVERTRTQVAHLLSVLQQGTAANWIGLISWLNDDICRFTFPVAPIVGDFQLEHVRGKEVVRETFQHRLGLHEHHVLKARYSPGPPPPALVPWRLHALVAALPAMLHAAVGVVDGLLIRERHVEWDSFESSREHEVVPPPREPHWDPALVVGPFVLAGWSDRDFPRSQISWRGARRLARRMAVSLR